MHTAHCLFVASLVWSFASLGCSGESFEPEDPSAADAGTDAVSEVSGKLDAPAKDVGNKDSAMFDAPGDSVAKDVVVDAVSAADVVSEEACTAKSVDFEAEADGMILSEANNCAASISFTVDGCMNLNQTGSRVIMRFQLGPAAAERVRNKNLESAVLVLTLANQLKECSPDLSGTAQNTGGDIAVHPLRSDWKEGGSYAGAQWCYRQGSGDQWQAADAWGHPGAEGAADHGEVVASMSLTPASVPLKLPLNPGPLESWLTDGGKLSLLLSAPAGSKVLAYVRARESGAPPKLRLGWCE